MIDRVTIVIFDEQPIYRLGLAQVLTDSNRYSVLAEGSTSEDAVRVASEFNPNVMLLDAHLPGGGIKTLESLSASACETRTIVLTNNESEHDLNASFQAGACGYVCKDVKADQLLDIVDTVHRGKMYMEPTLAGSMMANRFNEKSVDDRMLGALSAREEQVLRDVVKGYTNKEIARNCDLAEKTIKHHMTSILGKIQARNRVEAAMFARERFGWS